MLLDAPIRTLRQYNLFKLRKDLLAGLTVSVVEIPQAMAYAIIAGVPPVYGIYTSIIQGAVAALFSSSQHLTTGPTNTQSLLVASAIHRLVATGASPAAYLELVFALTLLKGLIQLAFAAGRMGNMVRYVSRSVIVGLVSGAGVLIFFGQIPAFLGMEAGTPSGWPGIIGPIQQLIHHAHGLNWHAIAIGSLALAVIIVFRMIHPLMPAALLAVIITAATVAALGWGPQMVSFIEPLPASLPAFHVPQLTFNIAEQLFGGALALAVIGLLESVAIAKSIAARTGEIISPNQEFFAQGLSNSIASFFQCIPGSASFGRSALDYSAGAQTRFAAVFNAIFVLALFLLLGPMTGYIPRAALAAVLLVIAAGLIDWRYVLQLARTSRSDTTVCITTFLATLFIPLEYAIFTGIFLNIGLYLREASKLHLHEMLPSPSGRPFIETPIHDRSGHKRVIFLQLEGDLFFGVADELQDRLTSLSHSGVRVTILRLKRTHSIDATALHVLESFAKQNQERGGHVILCGVRPELMRVLKGYGLVDTLGRDNVFETRGGVFESAKQALARARVLSAASIDIRPLEAEMENEPVTYDI